MWVQGEVCACVHTCCSQSREMEEGDLSFVMLAEMLFILYFREIQNVWDVPMITQMMVQNH